MSKFQIINFARDFDKLITKKSELADNLIKTGLETWDQNFDGLRRGGIHLIAAPSGHGKTSFMISMSKLLASQKFKVLYIGTEQTEFELLDTFGRVNVDFILKDSSFTLNELFNDLDTQYDVIFYDYLGAESGANDTNKSEWQVYRDQMDALHQLALSINCAIITACQATADILNAGPNPGARGSQFIAFSKNIQNSINLGIYLIRNSDNSGCNLSMFKNRYGRFNSAPIPVFMDYKSKQFSKIGVNNENNRSTNSINSITSRYIRSHIK